MMTVTNETQVEVTLKPCPFCGGSAELLDWDFPYRRFQVRCSKCGASASGRRAHDPEAITAWNTRIQAEKRNNALAVELRRKIESVMGIETPVMKGDNLAVTLCSYFEDRGSEELDDNGWTEEATAAYEEIKSAVEAHFTPILAALEGGE